MDLNEQKFIDKYMPKGCLYNNKLFCRLTSPEILKKCKQFEFRSSDILIATYPKSGL